MPGQYFPINLNPCTLFVSVARMLHALCAHACMLFSSLCSSCLTPPAVRYCICAEIKVPSVHNAELTNVLPLHAGAGQNTATYAIPTARNIFFVLISTFPIHSPLFFPNPLPNFYTIVRPFFSSSRPME